MKGELPAQRQATLTIEEGGVSLVDTDGSFIEIENEYLHGEGIPVTYQWATDCPAYDDDGKFIGGYFDGTQSHGSRCDCNIWVNIKPA